MATWRVIDSDRNQIGFTTQPGMGYRALLGVDRLLQWYTTELHIGTEIKVTTFSTGNGTHIKMGYRRKRTSGC